MSNNEHRIEWSPIWSVITRDEQNWTTAKQESNLLVTSLELLRNSDSRQRLQAKRIHQVHQGKNSLVEECGPQQGWALINHLL